MGVGSVTSMNNMSSIQMARAGSKDVKSKKIQSEITDLQQKMQKVSSNDALSIDEKVNERKKQQQEISNLNTELKRQQEEFLRSQKRELMLDQLQKDKEPVDASEQKTGYQGTVIFQNSDGTVILKEDMSQNEERSVDTDKRQADETKEESRAEKETKPADDDKDMDAGLPDKELHAIVSRDVSAQQANRQETVISEIKGSIAVLKGEINQDERHGINTDKKQAELEKLEKQEEKARAFKEFVLDEKNSAKKPEAKMKVSGIQSNAEDNDLVNISGLQKEDKASQQKFYVSF